MDAQDPFKPVDPTKGDPSLMRGRAAPLADWVVRQASAAINGVGSLMRGGAGDRTPSPSRALAVIPPSAPGSIYRPIPLAERREPWFGPGTPPVPMAPKADVAGRAFDYLPGQNMGNRPRQYAGTSFEQLRALADALDIARLCIETRKDQMGRLTWSILPKQSAGQAKRPGLADDRCRYVEGFLASPDKVHTWDGWLRMILEDQLVIDATSLYVRKTLGGDVYSIDVVDGATIKPLIDVTGRTPIAPDPAYQQVLKGMAAVNYTSDELLYAPRNPRADKIYGLSVMEQLVMTVNIAIRREVVKMKYFSENNIPEALVSVPKEWNPDQVASFQVMWDSLLKAQQNSAGLKFVPGGMIYQPTRADSMLMGPFDEWLARVVCFAFSLPPTAFVQQQNRATAETASETALEEGLAPMMVWFKGLMDRIVQQVFGYTDLEFTWDDVKQMEVEAERAQDLQDIAAGILSRDEVRAKRGLDPIGMGHTIPGGPNGVIFIDDLLEAKKAGLTKIQPPPAPPQLDEFGNPVPPAPMGGPGMDPGMGAGPPQDPTQLSGNAAGAGMPMPQPRPAPPASRPLNDPLAGIPPSILAAVGLGPQGGGGRLIDVTQGEERQTDPGMSAVGHPQTLAMLRAVEAMHRGRR